MYGQKIHLKEAMQPDSYGCDMLPRERMKPQRLLAYPQIFTLLA